MAIQNGTAAFAAASGTTAATRMIWATAAVLLGAAVLAPPVARGPFRHSMAWNGVGGLISAGPSTTVTHFPVPLPEAGLSLTRLNPAAPAYGAGSFRAVTASDTAPLEAGCRGLYVATGGTISVKGVFDNTAVSLGTVAAGVTIPGRFGYVMASGTTAVLVALYS